jgi:hypothetical protein
MLKIVKHESWQQYKQSTCFVIDHYRFCENSESLTQSTNLLWLVQQCVNVLLAQIFLSRGLNSL